MQQTDIEWSNEEKKIALTTIQKAYSQEVEKLVQTIRENASAIVKLEDAWQLHDYLSAKRHEIEGRYDDRESFLMFTLSQLIKDGLAEFSDLTGLGQAKQAKIKMLSRM